MNNQESFMFPNMGLIPNFNNINQEIRNLQNRVTRLEREVRRLNNRIDRLERPTPFGDFQNYQTDSYNMM